MGQACSRPVSCRYGCCSCPRCTDLCFLTKETQEPRYARYLSTSEEGIDLHDIVGEFLELDPVLTDRESGEEKINQWIEDSSPQLGLPESDIGINRLKCVKYWDAVLGKDISKLSGSTVNFCFERKTAEDLPRLVIEHRGKSVFVRNASKRASNKHQQPTYTRPLMEQQAQQQNSDKEVET